VPICVTAGESGGDGGGLKYQTFFDELIGKIRGQAGDVEVETKDLTLNALYPLHGELDKEEMTFFTHEYPDMMKEGIGEIEHLHIIVFKNHLVLNCNKIANKLVRAILGFDMGSCNANQDDDMCLQVQLKGKFSDLMKKASKRHRNPDRDLDIFAVSLRLSPEDYKRLTTKKEDKVNGKDEDEDGKNDKNGKDDKEGKTDSKEEFDIPVKKNIANMGIEYSISLGLSILFIFCLMFYVTYYIPAGGFSGGWDLMTADIAGFVKRVFSIGIGPGLSVMTMQVLQPKKKRGFFAARMSHKDDDIFNVETEVVDLAGIATGARDVQSGVSYEKLLKQQRRGTNVLKAAIKMRYMQKSIAAMMP